MNAMSKEEIDELDLSPEEFFKALTKSDRMLIALRDELYDGDWVTMREDISNRMKGQPYLFKFVHRAEKDLESIEKISSFEKTHNVDLNMFLKKER